MLLGVSLDARCACVARLDHGDLLARVLGVAVLVNLGSRGQHQQSDVGEVREMYEGVR